MGTDMRAARFKKKCTEPPFMGYGPFQTVKRPWNLKSAPAPCLTEQFTKIRVPLWLPRDTQLGKTAATDLPVSVSAIVDRLVWLSATGLLCERSSPRRRDRISVGEQPVLGLNTFVVGSPPPAASFGLSVTPGP